MFRRIPRNVILLGLVSLATDASAEMITPLLPVFIAALGSGAVALGVIEGIADTTAALVKLLGGYLSDRFRRRKIFVIVGYAIASIARPLTSVVANAWQIVAIRTTDRIGKGIRTAPRDALIASSTPQEDWGLAYGFHRGMDNAGAVIGPLLAITALLFLTIAGGISDITVTLRWTFALAFIPALFAIIATFFIEENVDHPRASKPIAFSLDGFDGRFKRYLVIVVLFTLGNSADGFLLFRAAEIANTGGWLHERVMVFPVLQRMLATFGDAETQRRAVDALFLPIVWCFFHILKVISSPTLGALSDRVGRVRVISAGWILYAIVYAGFASLDYLTAGGVQVAGVFILFSVYAVYYGFTEGAERALVADLVPADRRGSAFGLFNFAVAIGSLPASILFGVMYQQFGGEIAFGSGAVIAMVSVVGLRSFVRVR